MELFSALPAWTWLLMALGAVLIIAGIVIRFVKRTASKAFMALMLFPGLVSAAFGAVGAGAWWNSVDSTYIKPVRAIYGPSVNTADLLPCITGNRCTINVKKGKISVPVHLVKKNGILVPAR